MINNIDIIKYRKLEGKFNFSKEVNIISGTNGSCKSSLLYIISNSFKRKPLTEVTGDQKKCLESIYKLNTRFNPKIESLTRGDDQYNDPAIGISGTIFSVNYDDKMSLNFRKHNSKTANRYAVKPKYKAGAKEYLPAAPVIYLGLSRLISYGEYTEDDTVKKIEASLPVQYRKTISELYANFTGQDIDFENVSFEALNEGKYRAKFITDIDGVDSNTISAGEDNLYIILLSLVSLKYYYETFNKQDNNVSSILIIDELDATLHPTYQNKLLKLIRDFSNSYRIQFFATTHSLTTIENTLQNGNNLLYLINNVDTVDLYENPDLATITGYLETSQDRYTYSKIPIFSEDPEARILIKKIFDYFARTKPSSFGRLSNRLHFLEASISSESLKKMFGDYVINSSILKCICILDGDQNTNLENHIMTLPGKNNPEEFLIQYAQILATEIKHRPFWQHSGPAGRLSLSKDYFNTDILREYNSILQHLTTLKEQGTSTKGVKRELMKKFFEKHRIFFEAVFDYWLCDDDNTQELNKFYGNFKIIFKRICIAHNIDKRLLDE